MRIITIPVGCIFSPIRRYWYIVHNEANHFFLLCCSWVRCIFYLKKKWLYFICLNIIGLQHKHASPNHLLYAYISISISVLPLICLLINLHNLRFDALHLNFCLPSIASQYYTLLCSLRHAFPRISFSHYDVITLTSSSATPRLALQRY